MAENASTKAPKALKQKSLNFSAFPIQAATARQTPTTIDARKSPKDPPNMGAKNAETPTYPSPCVSQSYWTVFGAWISCSCLSASSTVIFPSQKWRDTSFTRQIRLILVHRSATRLTRVSGSLFGSLNVTKIPVPYTIVSVCSYSERFNIWFIVSSTL